MLQQTVSLGLRCLWKYSAFTGWEVWGPHTAGSALSWTTEKDKHRCTTYTEDKILGGVFLVLVADDPTFLLTPAVLR